MPLRRLRLREFFDSLDSWRPSSSRGSTRFGFWSGPRVADLEILALRHQLTVVNRSRRPRLRFTSADRMLWAWFSRSWRGWRSALYIVRPQTVVAWHRRGFRLFWTWKSRPRTGRPGAPADVRALIRELSTANPLWGAPRPRRASEVGISVSQSTVAKCMRRHPRPPSQTWRTFLTTTRARLWPPTCSSCRR